MSQLRHHDAFEPRVLITGFEPFGEETHNPSEMIARALDGSLISGRGVRGVVLPCRFGAALTQLRRLLRTERPALTICLGVAGGRQAITPERIAVNLIDAGIPDNAGRQPRDKPVARDGPAAYFSRLPVKAIVNRLRDLGHPAEISLSAGSYVCNHLFYGLMHELSGTPGARGGFIHIPRLPEHGGPARLSLENQIDAIINAAAVCLRTRAIRGTAAP